MGQNIVTITREKILELEALITDAVNSGQVENKLGECPVRHFQIPGGYAREMTIPAHTLAVGKVHKHPCITIISQGKVLIATEFGTETHTAPCTFVSPAGVKRVALALQDTILTTFHTVKETNIEDIEKELVSTTYDALPPSNIKLLGNT